MPTLTIEERILVSAPPAKVWAFLLDPARVAPCLPGAKLDGTEGDKTFLGTMKVKVGPVTMDFKGKATMTEIHEEERRVVMVGTGNDKGGSGSAKMSMESRILAVEGKGSEIVVTAEVDLAGKLMSFGRGMMTGISRQLFKQFSERVRAELETEDEEQEESAAEQAAPVEEARKAEEKAVEEPKNEEAPAAEARKEEAIAVEEPKKEEAAVEEVKKDEAPPAEAEKTEAAAEEPKKEEAVAEDWEGMPAIRRATRGRGWSCVDRRYRRSRRRVNRAGLTAGRPCSTTFPLRRTRTAPGSSRS
ncbi:MAG: SRPBCC domain-containing protein [Byssovorax sp.]